MKKRDFLKIIAGLFASSSYEKNIDVNKEVSISGDGRLSSKVINVEPWGDIKVNYWKELDSRKLS